MILERITGIREIPREKNRILRRSITLLIVIIGWVFFRSENITQAVGFLGAMFTLTDLPISYELSQVLNERNLIFLMAALPVFLLPVDFSLIRILIEKKEPVPLLAGAVMILLVLPYCAALIVGGASSPFIYFRF